MTDSIQKILQFYEAENAGVLNNLARMLQHGYLGGTGKMVILPVDQGFEHGPLASFADEPRAFDPLYHFQLAVEARLSAYAAPAGFLRAGARSFAGKIPLILKLNNADKLYKNLSAPLPALTACVDEALELGCAGVGLTIYPGSMAAPQMYEQAAVISQEARRRGLVVVIWSYPRGAGAEGEAQTAVDVVSYAAHIAAQLGAHIIKVKPPRDLITDQSLQKTLQEKCMAAKTLAQRVQLVIQSAFNGRRIVIFSGGPAKQTSALLKEVKELSQGGSFGSIVGRNAFKRPRPQALRLLRDIMDIYKNDTTP